MQRIYYATNAGCLYQVGIPVILASSYFQQGSIIKSHQISLIGSYGWDLRHRDNKVISECLNKACVLWALAHGRNISGCRTKRRAQHKYTPAKIQVGRFACPSSMLKDHPLENTGLLNAFVADASCFLRMFYAVVSQRFQKRASGSAVEPAWLGDRCPPCSVAGRGGKNVSVRSWDFTARERRESLLRGAGSTCLGLPESFVFLSREAPRWQTPKLQARASLQGCCRQQEGCLLKPFFPLFCPLATFGFSTEDVNCSGRYLDIMQGFVSQEFSFGLTLGRS